MGLADLGLGFGLYVRVNRKCNLVGFVNGRRFRLLLLRDGIRLLQPYKFKAIHSINDFVELVLNSWIRTGASRRTGEEIKGAIEVAFCRIRAASRIVCLPC